MQIVHVELEKMNTFKLTQKLLCSTGLLVTGNDDVEARVATLINIMLSSTLFCFATLPNVNFIYGCDKIEDLTYASCHLIFFVYIPISYVSIALKKEKIKKIFLTIQAIRDERKFKYDEVFILTKN